MCKIGDRETHKDGIVSKLQRHIVSQRKLLIVIHLFSSRFLDPSVLSTDVYVCFFVGLSCMHVEKTIFSKSLIRMYAKHFACV